MQLDIPDSTKSPLPKALRFLDSDYFENGRDAVLAMPHSSDNRRWLPFMIVHGICLGVFWTGASAVAVGTAIAIYWLRMFAITGIYHRYFSHRTYKCSRPVQFLFALLGMTAVQRGPLWWASHHRNHHKNSDRPGDTHSPVQDGFLWAHIGWITAPSNMPTDYSRIPDLVRYPELVWLNRFDLLVPIVSGFMMFGFGEALKVFAPQLHTNGPQMLVWSFISTVVCMHATFCINSLAHVFGSRRFETEDQSRNNFWLAIITMGEGWHNNHHRYPGLARQGLYWYEIDFTYYILLALEALGVVSDLRKVPFEMSESAAIVKPREKTVQADSPEVVASSRS
jgi:stearoyl-CoA desaturase (delta-9 desaturase)